MNDAKGFHIRLLDFARNMGFRVSLTEDDTSKLCKGEMKFILNHIMNKVRPASEVETIRKNILLQRIKASLNENEVEHLELLEERESLESQLSEKRHIIAKMEETVINLKYNLIMLCNEAQQIVSDTENLNKKCFLLKQFANVLQSEQARYKEIHEILTNLLKALQPERENSAGDGSKVEDVTGVLQQCYNQIGKLKHLQGGRDSIDAILGQTTSQSIASDLKDEIFTFLQNLAVPFSPQELYSALLQHQMKLNSRMKALVADVNKERDSLLLSQDMNQLGIDITSGFTHISAFHIKIALEAHIKREQNACTRKKLEAAKKELGNTLLENMKMHSSDVTEEQCQKWINKKIHLKALQFKRKSLQEELKKLQGSTCDFNYFQWCIQKDKENVEALLAKKERKARWVTENLDKLNAKTFTLASLRTKTIAKLNTFDSSYQDLVSYIPKLKGTAAQEVKTFLDVPLEALHCTPLLDGTLTPSYELLPNYQMVAPVCSEHLPEVMTLLENAPIAPVEDIVMKLYQRKCYLELLNRTVSAEKTMDSDIAPFDPNLPEEFKAHMQEKSCEHDQILSEFLDNSESIINDVAQRRFAWETHPFVTAVPNRMTVDGKPLEEWQTNYEDLLKLLNGDDSFQPLDSTSEESVL